MRFLKQIFNNLNWNRRDQEIGDVQQLYWSTIDLPRATNGQISVDEFRSRCAAYMKERNYVLEKYGNRWSILLPELR